METPSGGPPGADVRDYLAEERTFLAWIRTSLALMAFGFVVARFGLFLAEIQVTRGGPAAAPKGFSLWFGTAFIAVGVAMNLLSIRRHVRLVGELNHGQFGFVPGVGWRSNGALSNLGLMPGETPHSWGSTHASLPPSPIACSWCSPGCRGPRLQRTSWSSSLSPRIIYSRHLRCRLALWEANRLGPRAESARNPLSAFEQVAL